MANASIGKADGSNVIEQKGESWNVADSYAKIKILRLLIQLDLYETIAQFGKNDQEEDIPHSMIPQRRIEALQRVIFTLKQLLGNCKFSLDKGKTKNKIENLYRRIENVENVSDGIYFVVFNEVTKRKSITINEYHFRKCFNILREIKDEINIPLNEAGLIFKKSDEVDLDQIMNTVVEGM